MPMNIVQLQKQLEMLPDQALAGYVQRPSGEVPQYLVLSELGRRQKLRQSAGGMGGAQAPRSTVKDDLLNQGLGAMSAQGPGAEQAYAAGGIVSFADGGNVGDDYQGVMGYEYPGMGPGAFTPEQYRAAQEADAQRAAEERAYYEAHPEAASDLASLQNVWGGVKRVAGAVGSKLGDVATFIPRVVATGAEQIARVPRAMGVNVPRVPGSFDVAAMQNPSAAAPAAGGKQKDISDVINAATDAAAPSAPRMPTAVPTGGIPSARVPGGGGIASLGMSARSKTAGVGGGGKGIASDTTYKPITIEEQIANAKKIQESLGSKDEFKSDREMLAAQQEELKGRKQGNINNALIQAGLGMMAGKSQYALTNIGEGGMAGLAYLDKANAADDAAKRATMQAQMDLSRAEGAARRGDQQMAIGLAGQAEKDRQFAVTAAQQRENYLLAHQDRMAQINATLQAASMRVAQGAGTKSDKLMLDAYGKAEAATKNDVAALKNNPMFILLPQEQQDEKIAQIRAARHAEAFASIGKETPEGMAQPVQSQNRVIDFSKIK